MTYAIVKSRHLSGRSYRVCEILMTRDCREFGVTVDETGKPSWKTYRNKAEAIKAARKLYDGPRGFFVCEIYEETPFAPMTGQLRRII